MKTASPKDFWKLFTQKGKKCCFSTEEMFEHFKSLSLDDNIENDNSSLVDTFVNNELNDDISCVYEELDDTNN